MLNGCFVTLSPTAYPTACSVNMFYYVDDVSPSAEAYLRYDTRVAWLAVPGLEVSLIGRNLTGSAHTEFPNTPLAEFSRSVVGQVLWQF